MRDNKNINKRDTFKRGIIKVTANLCRIVLGLTFIFSGYVKAIDPLGTVYKINDYLAALNLAGVFPDQVILIVAIALSTFEFSLGIFMLFAIRRRLVSKLTLLFMIVMTVISLWLAIFNPVKDCGCFGDAIILTNKETLIKNIILSVCAVIVWLKPMKMIRFINKPRQWLAINYTILFILISTIWSLWNLPQFDFRPYHIGANIKKGMEIPKGAKQPVFNTTFIMEKDGQRKEFDINNYPDSTWKFIDSKTEVVDNGYVPPIHDFSIEDRKTGKDLTKEILANKGYTFLLISPFLEKADDSDFGDIDKIYEYAQNNGYAFYCLTASNDAGISKWQDITGAEYPFYITDEVTLKTIIRSNPGLLLIKNGTVIRKWSHNRLPEIDDSTKPLNKIAIGALPSDPIPRKILRIMLWFILPLLLLSISGRYIPLPFINGRQGKRKKRKEEKEV